MSEIYSTIDFNEPVDATQIFRMSMPEGKVVEHSMKVYFGWEDVRSIESYPYIDNWENFKGPKYYINLRDQTDPKLILGDINVALGLWTAFRTTFPLFVLPPNEEDGLDKD